MYVNHLKKKLLKGLFNKQNKKTLFLNRRVVKVKFFQHK